MSYFAFLFIFALSACVSVHPVNHANGIPEVLVTCTIPSACYDKAKQVCKGNYKIMDSQDNWDTSKTNILVKCEQNPDQK